MKFLSMYKFSTRPDFLFYEFFLHFLNNVISRKSDSYMERFLFRDRFLYCRESIMIDKGESKNLLFDY